MRKRREAAGLTQEEVAARARLSREYVSHLEREEYSPTVEVLLRLCAALNTRAWRVLHRLEEGHEPREADQEP